MKSPLSAICVLLVCAAAKAATPSDESVEKLLSAMGTERLIATMPKQLEGVMKSSMDQAFKGQQMTPEARQIADSLAKKMIKNYQDELSWDKMKPLYVQVYRETFTQDEIDGLIVFYESPVGAAFVSKMPTVIQKSMSLAQQRIGPIMQKTQQAIQETVRELQAVKEREANHSQDPTPSPVTSPVERPARQP
jgi:uncharacterized protein